eukprot:TRINITY_DN32045_c0_g1_i1.p1 TRINITY_DN32045_c0_g1~~TRINITY_DN32045_c0_g1_i1.p1  ORF type:complete len:407 (+),score=73.64 TRINITY_DN32045_c0_g1_i1:85-1221(+)
MTVPDESQPIETHLRQGVLVRVRGLSSAAGKSLNGQLGRCDRFEEKTGRWGVLLNDGSSKALKPENLFSFDEYMQIAHGGVVPTSVAPYLEDFQRNPKYGALPGDAGSLVIHKDGKKPGGYATKVEESPMDMLKALQRQGRKASPRLSPEEEGSGKFSKFTVKDSEVTAGSMRFAIIAPEAPKKEKGAERKPLPTVLAVSRGDQRHVARLFRAMRAEQRGWQVLVPMRVDNSSPDFFSPPGMKMLQEFMDAVLDESNSELVPFSVMSGVFHFVGVSHGAASMLGLATLQPERVASLSMVTGFLPTFCSLEAIRSLKDVHFYVGEDDEMGHKEYLKDVSIKLKAVGGHPHTHVVKGAGHYDITEHLDLEEFWRRLEAAR